MENYSQIQLNAAQLSLLLSREVGKELLEPSVINKNPSRPVTYLKKKGIINKTKCFDPRYDKLDEFDFAVKSIYEKGLNRDLEEKILTSKNCIQKCDLVGAFAFLKLFLTDDYMKKLKGSLKSKLEFHSRTSWVHYCAKMPVITPQQLMKL